MKKGFGIIWAILIVVILGGGVYGGYYFWQKRQSRTSTLTPSPTPTPTETSSPTANWQVYENTRYHYKIKYPSNFYLHQRGYGPLPPIVVRFGNYPEGTGQLGGDYAHVYIGMLEENTPSPPEEYSEAQNLISKGYQRSNTTVAGVSALRLERTTNTTGGMFIVIYFIKNSILFRIDLDASSLNFAQQYFDTFNQMVSTLEFF